MFPYGLAPAVRRRQANELVATIKRFVVLLSEAADAIALRVLFAHCFAVAEISPRRFIKAPTRGCGKTRLLEVLGHLVPCPLQTSNTTPSALFRAIEACKLPPTVLFDEADAAFKRGANEELRGLLNAGHTPDHAFVTRSVKVGDDWAVKKFSVWCPLAIAAIKNLPATVEDRSIIIPMRRRRPDEPIEPGRRRTLAGLAIFAQKASRWAADDLEALCDVRPTMDKDLSDRTADNWELLVAIADRCGGNWPARARKAALLLSAADVLDNDSPEFELLGDIRQVFEGCMDSQISSAALVNLLKELDSRPWKEAFGGRPLTPHRLARMLRHFGIAPGKLKSGDANGYKLSHFDDAFARYLAAPSHIPPVGSFKPSETAGAEGKFRFTQPSDATSSRRFQTRTKPYGEKEFGSFEGSSRGIGTRMWMLLVPASRQTR
jgi:putative DNA primase/helicase